MDHRDSGASQTCAWVFEPENHEPLAAARRWTERKWEALKKVLDNATEKFGSEAKFRCLQGDLSEESVMELLESVAAGTITVEQEAAGNRTEA